jgi:hypothetical protein
MLINKIAANVYRVVLGSNENETYYVAKGFRGTWRVAQNGTNLDFAPTRTAAINAAISLHKGVTA